MERINPKGVTMKEDLNRGDGDRGRKETNDKPHNPAKFKNKNDVQNSNYTN